MPDGGGLVAQPLGSQQDFNWVLLIELLVCAILAIFFYGYFDRLFATIISYAIRAYTWRTYNAYVDIQAIQLSLLGGRIFFKGIRYHAHNETILIHSGYVTWNYWHRKVRDAQVFNEKDPPITGSTSPSISHGANLDLQESGGRKKEKSELPCRINIKLEGVQAFMYNRSPVYDAIIEHFAKTSGSADQAGSVHDTVGIGKSTGTDSTGSGMSGLHKLEKCMKFSKETEKPQVERKVNGYPGDERDVYMANKNVSSSTLKLPSFLQLFPIGVSCKLAAVVLGNENTKAIITAKLNNANGTFDAGPAGPLDVYKILFGFEFDEVVIKMKPNHDFKALQLTVAAGLKSGTSDDMIEKLTKKARKTKTTRERLHYFDQLFGKRGSTTSVRATDIGHEKVPNLQFSNPIPGQDRWQGLSRYLDDEVVNEHDEWDPIEYALYSTLAEVPKMGMTFYWDIPGPTPKPVKGDTDPEFADDINCSRPPAYGMDLTVHGGILHYGPWADRQRFDFQNIFFPSSYADAIPARRLLPGEPRVSTEFKLFLSIEQDTVLRMPFREQSKDWKWKGRAEAFVSKPKTHEGRSQSKSRGKRKPFWKSREKGKTGPTMRPFAWLDIAVKRDSTISYFSDMIARRDGYRSRVRADISGLEISTSVNHGLLWRSGSTVLDADTSVPLGWNAAREWTFNILNENLELFILRDHLFLLTDAIGDWAAGPLAEYFTFTPFKYTLDATFRDFKMYLNTNKSNIIDEPASFDKNQYLVLYGRELHADVTIPLNKFRPVRNEVFFEVMAKELGFQLCLSPGNTVAAFSGPVKVVTLNSVSLNGSHAYFLETSTELTDRLTFRVHGDCIDVRLFGFVVDRMVTLIDNYFGKDLHFRTLEEFQELARGINTTTESDAKAQLANRGNDLDVIVIITAEHIKGHLPSSMYNADESIAVDCAYASADLRLTNYYMDIELDCSPLAVSHARPTTFAGQSEISTSQTEVFIASSNLTGHRVFGLPPTEPDYVCLWSVDVGKITGECSSEFVNQLSRSIACLGSSIDDLENAMSLIPQAVLRDLQFLRLRTQDIKIWFRLSTEALLLSTGPASVDLRDWAEAPFSQRINVLIPDLILAIVDAQSALRPPLRPHEAKNVNTHAYSTTTISLSVLNRKLHFTDELQKQQELLIESDSRTGRAPFFILSNRFSEVRSSIGRLRPEPPAMIAPPIPEPLGDGEAFSTDYSSLASSSVPRSLKRMLSSDTLRTSTSNFSRRSSSSLSASVRRLFRSTSRRNFSPRAALNSQSRQSSSQTLRLKLATQANGSRGPSELLSSDGDQAARFLPPGSISLTSSLAEPYFPLKLVEPDAADLPAPQTFPDWKRESTWLRFDDVANQDFDEETAHMSLIVNAPFGFRCFVKPRAIGLVTELIDLLLPKTPLQTLDALQVNIINAMSSVEKRDKGAGDALEFAFHIPFVAIRFLNSYEQAETGSAAGTDQFDFETKRVALAMRKKRQPTAHRDRVGSTSIHCSVGSLAASVKDNTRQKPSEQVAVKLELDDLLFWLTTNAKDSVHLSFRRFDVAMMSQQISVLAAIARRTFVLFEQRMLAFTSMHDKFADHQRYLIYSLTMAGQDVADPPFLNRTGIALRAVPHHLRNHDSWKIISRLRHVWNCLSTETKSTLETECNSGTALLPANARDVVTKNWDEWRAWDLAHVRKSYIMQKLFGKTEDTDSAFAIVAPTATEVQIRAGGVHLIIDPGERQTQFALNGAMVKLVSTPPYASNGPLSSADAENPTEDLVLQASASSATLSARWSVIDLVEHALEFAQNDLQSLLSKQKNGADGINSDGNISKKASENDATPNSQIPQRMAQSSARNIWKTFQVVVAIDDMGIAVDAENVNAVAASQAFNMSIVGTDKTASNDGLDVTALLHSAQSCVDFYSQQRHLLHMGADAPNLFISRDFQGKAAPDSEQLRFAGTTANIVVESKEELLGIVEAVDTVIRNEIKTAVDKIEPFIAQQANKDVRRVTRPQITLPKITVALIMEMYRFDVAIMPSLRYSMAGKLGRLSVKPFFQSVARLDINLDLGEHSHDLISRDGETSHTISVLKMPPINGRLKIERTADRLNLNVDSIVESIVFEAHEVHGLLSTLSRDEVSSTFAAITADLETLKQDLEAVIPRPATPRSTKKSSVKQVITYNADLTLAGIEIRADAPGKLKDSGTAKLLVAFNGMHVSAFNVSAESGDLLPLPEIHGRLREFFIDLLITDARGTRRSGNISLALAMHCTLRKSRKYKTKRNYNAQIRGITVNVYAETASAVTDVANHLQDRLRDVDLSREKQYLQRLRQPKRRPSTIMEDLAYSSSDLNMTASGLLLSYISVSLHDIQVSWIVGNSVAAFPNYAAEDLVLSIKLIDLTTKSENSSTLRLEDFQLQLVPQGQNPKIRSLNSALMPQVIFNVGYNSTETERNLAFQASGKSLDLVLDSMFMLPVDILQRSIDLALGKFRDVSSSWQMTPTASGAERKKILGDKRLSSLLVDGNFAGAVLRLQGRGRRHNATYSRAQTAADDRQHQSGRYGQFDDHGTDGARIETPGLAFKVQYKDTGSDSSVNAEVKVSGSSNTLVPTVVPLILEVSDSVKTIVAETESKPTKSPVAKSTPAKPMIDENLLSADPTELLGGTSFNLGIRICRQEFSLSCQPIARVAASAHLDDIYITANTVRSTETDHFIAVSAHFENLQASIQHIYSRQSTFNFSMERIALSIMNSKHINGIPGLSAVLKVYPMQTHINARQLHDFLLFREIWLPPEIRSSTAPAPTPSPSVDSQDYFVARYKQASNTAAFPWTATVQFVEMKVDIDMGQSIGKASLFIDDFWASSTKDSDWEQNLCASIARVGIDCNGRTSGFVDLAGMKARTMISWPQRDHRQTPSIQASAGFERLRVKAAFDYQAFGIADITSFDFLMYNVRPEDPKEKDRLVTTLEGDQVHVFVTANTAAQSVALYQAVEKLIQDTESAYAASLKDIEKFLHRQSAPRTETGTTILPEPVRKKKSDAGNAPISLYTDVVVTLNSIHVGAFPSAFFDSQIFLIEASAVQARFTAMVEDSKIRTGLGMTLGQLQVALTSVLHPTGPQTLQDIQVEQVVQTVAQSRSGVILRVPKVVASMETWHVPGNMTVEYKFRSLFEGKVDVGWNVGRISFIRNMYNTHARNLAGRLGKPLPESAVKITTERPPSSSSSGEAAQQGADEKEKITAVVNVPQSRYTYIPLEPPIIETPQLRDMGEATPPLEWIGLHRDRLPNVTHQIVIVALLGVAKEVEDAYARILGSS